MNILLTLLECFERLLVLRPKLSVNVDEKPKENKSPHLSQPPPDGTSPLRSQVKRKVFLVFVIFSKILALFLIGHGEDPSD